MEVARQTPAAWATPYVGIPYLPGGRTRKGASCYGVVYLIQTEHFKRPCPLYGDEITDADVAELALMIESERNSWPPVPDGQEQPGDIILLRVLGEFCHLGVVTRKGWMVHSLEPREPGAYSESVSESYEGRRWRLRRGGFYRFYQWDDNDN